MLAISVPMALGIAKWHQNAAAVRQQFARVPIGRRNDRFPKPKAVGQGAGRHLRFVEIWRDVDVTHRDEVEQCRLIDEPVEKNDVLLDAERAHARHQTLAVSLAFAPNEVGMRRAQDDIYRIGTAFQDRRHGIDHDFDALVGREQTERQDNGSAAEAELGLRRIRFDEGRVGNSVRDDLDLLRRNVDIRVRSNSRPFSAMTMTFDEASTTAVEDARAARVSARKEPCEAS